MITTFAPAKVNLFLRISNKRKDGYHNIFTLFERISLADRITISKAPRGIELISNKPITADQKDNLAYKAAELILSRKKVKRGVRIRVKKRIPIAAGLGGGSSDAAAVLVGINKLYNLKLNKKELIGLAKKLGADVPFFILNKPFAIGKGRGDRLREACLDATLWHLIVHPGNLKVSTGSVYEAFDKMPKRLTKACGGVKINPSLKHSMDLDELESMLYNDLQDTVIAEREAIGSVIRRLASSLCKVGIVSGSGPGVFCLYGTRKEAVSAKRKLLGSVPVSERRRWQVFIAKTFN